MPTSGCFRLPRNPIVTRIAVGDPVGGYNNINQKPPNHKMATAITGSDIIMQEIVECADNSPAPENVDTMTRGALRMTI